MQDGVSASAVPRLRMPGVLARPFVKGHAAFVPEPPVFEEACPALSPLGPLAQGPSGDLALFSGLFDF